MASECRVGVRATAAIAAVLSFALSYIISSAVDLRSFSLGLYGASVGLFATLSGFAVTAQTLAIGWSDKPSSRKAAQAWDDMVKFLHGTVVVSVLACVVSLLAVGVSQWHAGDSDWESHVRRVLFSAWSGFSVASVALSITVSRLLHVIAQASAPQRERLWRAPPKESDLENGPNEVAQGHEKAITTPPEPQ